VLFVSFACYLDDANGASVASRAMLEALARRGFAVEVLCGSILERPGERDLVSVLTARGSPVEIRGGDSWDVGAFGLRPLTPIHLRLEHRSVPITVLLGSTRPHAPTEDEYRNVLWLFEEAWARHRPEVVVSYGSGLLAREVLRRARSRGVATVFSLHNLRYQDPATFVDVDAVLVASRFAAEHYQATLGLRCTVLPNLVDFERARAADRRPTYVVFVNPTIEKGVGIFARIADELGRRRPDIPFLVVEGKGTVADVAACGLKLRAHGNVFFHEHTSDPRRFWRVARVCLLPSLVAENQPLVAIEAMINGVPVIGSDRGGIPETLGSAGSIVPVPDRLSPSSLIVPAPEETSPWVEEIRELWDSPTVYQEQSHRALMEANRWAPETLEPRYDRFFTTVRPGPGRSQANSSDR
jgi:glycosyltransferase involved in cell wall biosynthesis